MEILIPGLILVALMVWASTKIKKKAADAFEPETIKTDSYSLQKPEGFLHVLVDPDHQFYAYSREFGGGTTNKTRRGTIEIDVFQSASIVDVQKAIGNAAGAVQIVSETTTECELETEETANETSIRGFYKVIRAKSSVYRLRIAILSEYVDEYSDKVRDTLDSFSVHSN